MENEWKKGLPKHTYGLNGYYLFEILLSGTLLEKGSIVEAYAKDNKWRSGNAEIRQDEMEGWRETYDCNTAREAIDQYARHRGIVVKENLNDAFRRHIKTDSEEFINCEGCWQYFLLKTGQEHSLPAPEELFKIKDIARQAG